MARCETQQNVAGHRRFGGGGLVLRTPISGENPGITSDKDGAILLIEAIEGAPIVIPGGGWLLAADIVRQGSDLILTGADGTQVLIRDYFNLENPPDLMTGTGAVMSAQQVLTLAGPLAPGQYAQSTSTPVAEPIGQVVTASGTVEAVRVDGTRVVLSEGDPVYQGDILETTEDGAVSIEFADASTFSLGESGRMTLDEMVYDPGIQEGSFKISIVQGVFSFVSGQVAKTSPDAMVLNTPVATIGIRGTTVVGRADAEGSLNTITLLPDDNGEIGEIVVSNGASMQIINVAGGTITVAKIDESIPDVVILSKEQIQQVYENSVLTPVQESLDKVVIGPDIGIEESAEALVEKILAGEETEESGINLEETIEETTEETTEELTDLEPASGEEETDIDTSGLQALIGAANQLIDTIEETPPPLPPPPLPLPPPPPPPPPEPEPAPEPEPEPEPVLTPTDINGNVIDGYIVGATVFADSNDNGDPDVGEASDVTGLNGAFELLGASGSLVMRGGVDAATGLAFEGDMRAPAGSTVITPLTTLLDALIDAGETPLNAEILLQQALGLPVSVDITQTDPIAALLSGDPAAALFAGGAQILNSVILGGSLISGAGGGDIASTTNAVFAEIASQIIYFESIAGTADLSDPGLLTQIITDAGNATGVNVSGIAGDTADIIVTINAEVDAVIAGGIGDVTAFLTDITQVSIVAQGDAAAALVLAGSSGNVSVALADFTGSALTDAVANAANLVGDVDGNENPTVSGPVLATYTEDDAGFTFDLLSGAADVDATDALSVSDLILTGGDVSGVTVAGNSLIVDPGAYTSLALGASEIITYGYFIIDGNGGTVAQTATVTITGTNDLPAIDGVFNAALTESNAAQTAGGQLTITDADAGESSFAVQTATPGAYGSFSVSAAGLWSYDLNATAADALVADQVVTETFAVASLDGTGSQNVTVTITGTNDVPLIGGVTSGALTETDVAQTATGQLTINDADTGESSFAAQTAAGTYGSFSVNAAGLWSYDLNATAADALITDQVVTETFSVASADGTGSQNVTVTLTGTNDVPLIGGVTTGALTESLVAQQASGQLSIIDPDAGEAVFVAQSAVNGDYGLFNVAASGAWTYDLDPVAASPLTAGQVVTETFTVASLDGTGSQNVTVTLTGTEGAPVIGGDVAAALTESDVAQTATGQLTIIDPDAGESAFIGQDLTAGTYGTFSVSAVGAWSYGLDAAAADALIADQIVTETFTVTSIDGTPTDITVTITGTNDLPVISGSFSAPLAESDVGQSASGNLSITDVDTGEAVFVVQDATSGTYGSFSVSAAGAWSYDLNATAADALIADQVVTETFAVTGIDGTGSQNVTVSEL